MTAPAATLRDATLGYGRRAAVHHVTGQVRAGARLAVVGPNGAGKSTLLKGLAGAMKPLSGAVEAHGRVAFLPQQSAIDPHFPISALDFVAMGLWRRIGAFGRVGRDELARARAALATVGLAGFDDRLIGAVSGGQLQRLLFARVLLQDVDLIVLDEPFTAIDGRTTEDLLALLARWTGEGRTIVAALHDLDLVRRAFPETLLLAREAIFWGATEAALAPENLLRARQMAEAWSADAAPCARGAAA